MKMMKNAHAQACPTIHPFCAFLACLLVDYNENRKKNKYKLQIDFDLF